MLGTAGLSGLTLSFAGISVISVYIAGNAGNVDIGKIADLSVILPASLKFFN